MERAREFDRLPYNVAGVRVLVPLGHDGARAQAEQAARDAYAGQQASLRLALEQKLALLADQFRLRQNDMLLLQAENRMLRAKSESACWRVDLPVTGLGSDPEREVEEMVLLLHEKQREILTARLDALEVLTQISALVKPRQPDELYSLAPR